MTCILNVSFSYSVLLRFMTENVQHFMSRYKYIIQNRLLCHHTICQQLVYNIFHETWIFVYLCKRLVLRSIELSPGYRFYLSDNIDPKTNAGMRLLPCPGLATWRMLLASVHVESGWPRYSCPQCPAHCLRLCKARPSNNWARRMGSGGRVRWRAWVRARLWLWLQIIDGDTELRPGNKRDQNCTATRTRYLDI